MFEDIIELLLQKKDTLREEIEREFAERSAKIDELLSLAGYVEPAPVEEAPVVEVAEDRVIDEAVTESDTVAAPEPNGY